MEEESESLKLVQCPTFTQKLARSMFIYYLKSKGIKEIHPELKLDENKENYNVFRQQSCYIEENGTRIYRNLYSKDKLLDSVDGVTTMPELLQRSVLKYSTKNFLGYRPVISTEHENVKSAKPILRYEFGEYKWITYSQAWCRINNLALYFFQSGVSRDEKMALFLDTSIQWFTCCYALFRLASPVVTVYSTLSDDAIQYALNLTQATSILVDKKSGARLVSILSNIPTLKIIFCTGDCELLLGDFSFPEVRIVNIDALELNREISAEENATLENCSPAYTDLAFVMFTSGSTGYPKGVMISHQNLVSAVSSSQKDSSFLSDKVFICYLPQAHILEIITETVMYMMGGQLGFSHPLCLFDTSPMIKPGTKGDLSVLRPTFMVTVPLVLERAKKAILDKLKLLSPIKQIIFETAYNIKLNYLKAGLPIPILDKLMFDKLKVGFGGRLTHVYIAGAKPHINTEYFFNVIFGIFKQAYGLTETCCGGCFSNFDYWTPGNVGPVTACVELKLVPWVEGGYDPNDKKRPRGEVYLKGKCISPGYYKNEEATDNAFVTDETTGEVWFRTGDIAEFNSDGTFKIIDRRKDIIKLKHGEYVSLVHVENIFMLSHFVDFVCVCSNITDDYLVAIIVPNRETVKRISISEKIETELKEPDDLIKTEAIKDRIRLDINKIVKCSKLTKFEIPEKIIIVHDIWTPESNLLTPSGKIKRYSVAEKYKNYLS